MILVVCKYAKLHQNTFLTAPDGQKYLFWKKFLVVWKYVQMHQNTSLTTPDGNKYLFWKKVSAVLEICANASKHVFNHSRRSKISFLKKSLWFLVVWKYVKMHQNTFLTAPDGQKYLFCKKVSGGLVVRAKASKHVFNHSRR